MMLALGMELKFEHFLRLFSAPRAICMGIAGQLVLMPSVAVLIATTIPLGTSVAIGLILLAACPGGATSNMFSRYAQGDVALSVSLTAASGVAAPLTVPLIVGVGLSLFAASENVLRVSVPEMVITLVATTALPMCTGMVLYWLFPGRSAWVRGKLLAFSSAILVLLIVFLFVNLSQVQPDLTGIFARSSLAVLLLLGGSLLVTVFISRQLRISRREERTLVLEIGIQNVNLALVMALNFFEEPTFLGPVLVYMPFMLLMGVAVVFWGRSDAKAA